MSNILLIDLSSIGHAMFHVCANEPDPNAASTKTVERVRALASGQPHVAICLDSPPYFRTEISADYKAKRDKDNNAVVSHQLNVAADTLRADGFPLFGVNGYEADDIIATAVQKTVERFVVDEQEWSVTIASADKDILQLVSDRVQVKSLKDGSLIGPDEVQAKLGVSPDQVVDYLALVGDASDNIKGAEGIGAVKAKKLLTEFGNLEDTFAALDATPSRFANGTIASLREFQPRMATVRELITLRTDAPIAFDEVFRERVPADVAVFGGSMDELPEAENERELQLPEARRDDVGIQRSAEAVTSGQAVASQPRTPADRPGPRAEPAAVVRADGPADIQRDGPDGARADKGDGRKSEVVTYMDAIPRRPVENPEVLPPPSLDPKWQLEPRSMQQAKQVAADLFASRMFSAYGNAPAVLSTIMAGRELGFQTMASLRAIHVIDGKPSLSAGAIHSLVLTSGKAKYFRCTGRTATRATFETQRGDDPPMALSFTIEEAQQAWSKRAPDGTCDLKSFLASGYGKNPADLLVARAITKLARLVYPDICHGLYAPEELS